MSLSHLVIGAGEVGQALAEVLDCDIRDLAPATREDKYDIIHIAFPYNRYFINRVAEYRMQYEADYVVIHSTVPVGTCNTGRWIHSPVRGQHPNLVKSLVTFTKHFGGHGAIEMAALWGELVGPTEVHANSDDVEAMKLVELVWYGIEISFMQQVHSWCEKHGLEFEEVYTAGAESYNEGYHELGLDQYVKPILEWSGPGIGGHCVRQAGVKLIGNDFFTGLGEQLWEE